MIRRAGTINILAVVEALVNFVVVSVVLKICGFTGRSDALMAAWMLPLQLGRGFFGSVASGLQGLLRDAADEDRPEIARTGFLLISVVGLLVGAGLALGRELWVGASLAGAGPEVRALAASQAVVLAWLSTAGAVIEGARAVAYRDARFLQPTLARLAGTLASLGALITRGAQAGPLEMAGYLFAGQALEALLVVVWLARGPALGRGLWLPSRARAWRVGRSIFPPMIGGLPDIAVRIAMSGVASGLGPGVVAALACATRIRGAAQNLVLRGLSAATLSEGALKGRLQVLRAIRLAVCVGAVLCAGFSGFPEVVSRVLFLRGPRADAVGPALFFLVAWMGPAIFLAAAARVSISLAYARGDGDWNMGLALWVSATSAVVLGLLVWSGAALWGLATCRLAAMAVVLVRCSRYHRRLGPEAGAPEAIWLEGAILAGVATYLCSGVAARVAGWNLWLQALVAALAAPGVVALLEVARRRGLSRAGGHAEDSA